MLNEGDIAPDFTLPQFNNGPHRFYDSQQAAVLAFYKFSCPTCQFTFPFLQKIYEAYGDAFYFAAIAQDDSEKTAQFRKDFGITIPTFMDVPPYPVSNLYGLISVPAIFLIEPDRRIRYAGAAFVKQEILNLADVLAEKSGRPQIEPFANMDVPEIKPG